MISTLAKILLLSVVLEQGRCEKKQIYLAGTFPILGSEGWQGGQVRGAGVGEVTSLQHCFAGLSASGPPRPAGRQQQQGHPHQLPHQSGSQG